MVKSVENDSVLLWPTMMMMLIGRMMYTMAAAGQMMYDVDSSTSNEIFGQSIYDDTSFEFSTPPLDPEFNFTFFSQYNQFQQYNKVTHQGLDITSPHLFQSKTSAQLIAIFPGTIWCGVGNLAGNTELLGFFANTDNCCRAHDKCRLTIAPGETKYGLTNSGYFSRSHCVCDERFYYCLKEANSVVANKIGYTYFNLLRPQCFRKDYPIVTCLRWFNERCLVYIVNQAYGREWQWFDNREF